jgi:hypothetical protein
VKNLNLYYILKDKKIVAVDSALEWGMFFENIKNRRVGWKVCLDGTTISTVFLGIDHGWNNELPVLFETMVFLYPPGLAEKFTDDNLVDIETQRYEIWDQAIKGHKEMVQKYRVRHPIKIIVYFFHPYLKIITLFAFYKILGLKAKIKIFFRKKYITFESLTKRKVFSRNKVSNQEKAQVH